MGNVGQMDTRNGVASNAGKWILVLTASGLLVGPTGCSPAAVAGCGAGVLSGALLAGVAVSAGDDSANTTDKEDLESTGMAILGGALFGVVAGCTAAAVTDALAKPKKATKSVSQVWGKPNR